MAEEATKPVSAPAIILRPPTFSSARPPPDYQNPSLAFLERTWHVTHSTLPIWKSKRNVRIKYTRLPPASPSLPQEETDRIDDLVTYQSLDKEKVQTVHGIDKAAGNGTGEWDWRGKGLLKVASSHWEVLSWGEEEQSGIAWAVTMFAKTLFTPAGIDVYASDGQGMRAETLEGIKAALARIEDGDVQKMANDIFEIKRDDARQD